MASSRLQRAGGARSRHASGITLRVRDEGRVASVAVSGRLEEGGDAELRRVARALRSAGVVVLVVDLHELEAIDSVGTTAVLELEAENREREGWELAVVPPSPRVAPELSSPEMREILCLVAPQDARYMLDFYAASVRAASSGLGPQRHGR